MEKFAVDLDKVLDEFELDEDDADNSDQYHSLQLEFHRDSNAESRGQNVGIGAVGGWSESLQAPPPFVKNSHDDQHCTELVSANCSNDSCSQNNLPSSEKLENHESAPPMPTEGLCGESASARSSESVLWPALLNNGRTLETDKGAVVASNAPYTPETKPDENSSRNDISVAGNLPSSHLDVLPASQSSHPKYLYNVEGNHPDILGINSSSPISFELNAQEASNAGSLEYAQPNVLPQEPFLLPDLMSNNNAEIEIFPHNLHLESSNPAIVTENCLSLQNNTPAIVQESQSMSGIPEIANVHQSMEQRSPSDSAIGICCELHLDANLHNEILKPCSLSQNICDTVQSEIPPISELQQVESCSRFLPDVSAECQNVDILLPTRRPSDLSEPIRFDPNADVNTVDLNAELEELEEEHLRLQGAYKSSGIAVPSTSDSSDTIASIIENKLEPSSILALDLIDNENSSCADTAKDEESCIIPNEIFETPPLNELPKDLSSNSESLQRSKLELHVDNSCTPENSSFPSVTCQNSSESKNSACVAGIVSEEKVVDKCIDCEDDVSSESTGTDTLSSSGTLTDGDSTPEHNLSNAVSTSTAADPSTETPATYDEEKENATSVDNGMGQYDEEAQVSAEYSEEEEESGVGLVAPFWIPDEDASHCQECNVKFTVIRRRHHCRACGRVLCSPCCHFKAPLPYMEYKEARVCATCLQLLTDGRAESSSTASGALGRAPNPNNPMEYCSRIPPSQQVSAGASGPPPTVMVPVGVLKRDPVNVGSTTLGRSRASKQVIFSDGIRPGGDLTELGGQTQPSSPYRKTGRASRRITPNVPAYVFDPNSEVDVYEKQMRNEGPPVVFALQKNLTALVKLIKLDCCVGVEVWNVATRGLCNVGQEELVVLLEALPGEKCPPAQLFSFFHTIYQQANKGNLVTELGHTIFTDPDGFLGSKDHGGFLYIRPTFQCLQKLLLPPSPYVFAVLIQKWETPWAKVFPLRLMLRLGAEYRYYPCPLVSNRNRKPVYCEIGHTIMNLLVDFRNYAYTVPLIQGFVIHMEEKKTTLLIPRNRYERVWKALDNSNDHVLALAANFSPQADSHLVTVEDDDGHYSTQAINIHTRPRSVTGASFIVFNGALKSSSGLKAKSSIVEDGLMVQIPGEMMTSLRDALKNIKDFDIPCGPSFATEPDELVLIRWAQEDKNFNVGIKSPIDERQMDGVPSVKIHSATDYMNGDHLIRWTEVFIIQGENSNSNNDVNVSRLSECIARACCVALTPHLLELFTIGHTRVALRATIHQDNVGYEAGAGGNRLPSTCMNDLDTELIPVIHMATSNIVDQPVVLELLFHIMEQ